MVLSCVTIANLLFLKSKPMVFIFSFTLIFVRQRSLSQYLLSTFMNWRLNEKTLSIPYGKAIKMPTYPDFVFLASTFFSRSPFEKPNYLVWIHFSTAFVISKIWILYFEDVHARIYLCGWKRMFSIIAALLPLFNSCTTSPASVL